MSNGLKYDAVAIGTYTFDILARPVNAIPEGGGVALIDEIKLVVSGTAGATVVGLAKLGLSTLAVGAVGDDAQADFLLTTLAGHGVDVSVMQRVSGVPTSTTIMNVRSNGERPGFHVRGASDHLNPPRSMFPQILDARFVHLGGTGFLQAMDGPPSKRLLEAARAAGCTTTFDLYAPGPDTRSLVLPLLPFIDYAMPSIVEARALSGCNDPIDAAEFFLDGGAKIAAITLGAEGSIIVSADGPALRLPAFEVTVSDTTGCGDAYCAGMIAALARGFDLEMAGRFASAAAALVATGLGSDAGIVDFDDTLAKMRALRQR